MLQQFDAYQKSTAFTYDVSGNLVSVTDPLQHTTEYVYDGRNQKIREILPDPDGSSGLEVSPVTRFEYDGAGNQTVVAQIVAGGSSPVEWITTSAYDALNRLESVTLPDPDGSGPLTHPVTSYEYDAVGNRTKLTDPIGNETRWDYDKLDRVVRETNELNTARKYEYDEVGNLEKYTDRNGRVISYVYDERNRRTHEKWLAANGSVQRTITTVYNPMDWVTSVSDPSASISYSLYDDVGRPKTIELSKRPADTGLGRVKSGESAGRCGLRRTLAWHAVVIGGECGRHGWLGGGLRA